MQGPEERELSGTVQAALQSAVQRHTFPKSNVDVYCLVLESGGSDAAVAITAASLALADAGIEMYDLVSACCVVSCDCHCLHFFAKHLRLHLYPCMPVRPCSASCLTICFILDFVYNLAP